MKNYANLLPEDYRRKRLLRRRVLQWALVWGITMAAALPLWGVQTQRLLSEQQQLRERRDQYAPTQAMLLEIPRMQSEMQELSQRDVMVKKFTDDHPPLTALGMVSQAAASCNGKVRIFQLIVERPPTSTAAETADKPDAATVAPTKPSMLTLQGTGVDNQSVAKFVVNLRQSQMFHRVDLKSSVRGRMALSDVQRFVVECEF
jgi:hypothetical protein